MDYLQIDESPVKVLDPEVKGKAAQGYLWFYSAPGGYVFLEFHQSRGRDGPRERLRGFRGTYADDGYELYDALRKEQPHRLKRIGCTSHAGASSIKPCSNPASEASVVYRADASTLSLERETQGLRSPRAAPRADSKKPPPSGWP